MDGHCHVGTCGFYSLTAVVSFSLSDEPIDCSRLSGNESGFEKRAAKGLLPRDLTGEVVEACKVEAEDADNNVLLQVFLRQVRETVYSWQHCCQKARGLTCLHSWHFA